MGSGVTRRAVAEGDAGFLRRLFVSASPERLALAQAGMAPLLRQQHQAQAADHARRFPGADHQVVLRDGAPVGRLLVHRGDDGIHLVDVCLLPGHRGQGIGGALVRALLDEGRALARPVTLRVLAGNPARRLYARLGFTSRGASGPYERMAWTPPAGG